MHLTGPAFPDVRQYRASQNSQGGAAIFQGCTAATSGEHFAELGGASQGWKQADSRRRHRRHWSSADPPAPRPARAPSRINPHTVRRLLQHPSIRHIRCTPTKHTCTAAILRGGAMPLRQHDYKRRRPHAGRRTSTVPTSFKPFSCAWASQWRGMGGGVQRVALRNCWPHSRTAVTRLPRQPCERRRALGLAEGEHGPRS